MSEIIEVCIEVSGVVRSNGNVFTADCLRKMAAKDPDKLWIKEKPDGRVELWARAPFPSATLSSKEDLPNKPS